jgi:hypothetical protein
MLRSMTAEQYLEWRAFYEAEPFDNDREDYLIGYIIQVLSNAHRNTMLKRTPYTLDEVTPIFGDRPKPKRDWQTMKSIARDQVKASLPPVRRVKGKK